MHFFFLNKLNTLLLVPMINGKESYCDRIITKSNVINFPFSYQNPCPFHIRPSPFRTRPRYFRARPKYFCKSPVLFALGRVLFVSGLGIFALGQRTFIKGLYFSR